MRDLKGKWLLVMLGIALFQPAWADSTLDAVKKKGFIQCGVSQGISGFSIPGEKGNWQGIDVDYCKALAAAVLGDAKKVKFTPLSAKERFTALQSGEIDILSRNTTYTTTRDAALGFNFAGVIFYDGQGFMVRKDLGVTSTKELDGATICTNSGTTTELNVADYFRSRGMKYRPVVFEKTDEVVAAYENNRCDAYTTDKSGLYAQKLKLKQPQAHIILPETISKEPLGPVVRQGDDQWFNVAKWVLFALLQAEEFGIDSKNIDAKRKTNNPEIRRLLGDEGSLGKALGLNDDWAYQLIKQVGNYEQIYRKNVGADSPLAIPRELNALWVNGGLHYSPPFR